MKKLLLNISLEEGKIGILDINTYEKKFEQ